MADIAKTAKGCGIGCLGMIVFTIVASVGTIFGMSFGQPDTFWPVTLKCIALAVMLAVIMGFMYHLITKEVSKSGLNDSLDKVRNSHVKTFKQLCKSYRTETEVLKDKYESALDRRGDKTTTQLESEFVNIQEKYKQKEYALDMECRREEQAVIDESKSHVGLRGLKLYQWIGRLAGIASVVVLIIGMFYLLGSEEYGKVDNAPEGGWTAESITLPHLTDGALYVSNPDSLLTPETEASLNATLKRMDDELGIETAMVVVYHVANGDVFRFSQDLFDKYGIGKDDRGLVITVSYDDHQVRYHTGYALEADLTDAEAKQLHQNYLVPYMRANDPNAGMLAITDAIYCFLSKKDMPVIHVDQKPIPTVRELTETKLYLLLALLVIIGLFLWGFWNSIRSKITEISPRGLPVFSPWLYDHINRQKSDSFYSGESNYSGSDHNYSSSHSSSRSSYSSSSSRHSGGYSGGGSGGGGYTGSW